MWTRTIDEIQRRRLAVNGFVKHLHHTDAGKWLDNPDWVTINGTHVALENGVAVSGGKLVGRTFHSAKSVKSKKKIAENKTKTANSIKAAKFIGGIDAIKKSQPASKWKKIEKIEKIADKLRDMPNQTKIYVDFSAVDENYSNAPEDLVIIKNRYGDWDMVSSNDPSYNEEGIGVGFIASLIYKGDQNPVKSVRFPTPIEADEWEVPKDGKKRKALERYYEIKGIAKTVKSLLQNRAQLEKQISKRFIRQTKLYGYESFSSQVQHAEEALENELLKDDRFAKRALEVVPNGNFIVSNVAGDISFHLIKNGDNFSFSKNYMPPQGYNSGDKLDENDVLKLIKGNKHVRIDGQSLYHNVDCIDDVSKLYEEYSKEKDKEAKEKISEIDGKIKKEVGDLGTNNVDELSKIADKEILKAFPDYTKCKTANQVKILFNAKGHYSQHSEPADFGLADVDIAKGVAEKVDWLFNKFPAFKGKFNALSVTVGPIESNFSAAGVTQWNENSRVKLSGMFFGSIEDAEKLHKDMIKCGFWAKGTNWTNVITHEYGHAFEKEVMARFQNDHHGELPSNYVMQKVLEHPKWKGKSEAEIRAEVARYCGQNQFVDDQKGVVYDQKYRNLEFLAEGFSAFLARGDSGGSTVVDIVGREFTKIIDQYAGNGKTKKDSRTDSVSAVGMLVIKNGKILCGIRHSKTGYGMVCGPGGHVKHGETAQRAAIREAQEKFGITPIDLIKIGAGKAGRTGNEPVLFVCTAFRGKVSCRQKDQIGEPCFMTIEQLAKIERDLFGPFKDSLVLLVKRVAANFRVDEKKYLDDPDWVTINGTHVALENGRAVSGGKLVGKWFRNAKTVKKNKLSKTARNSIEKGGNASSKRTTDKITWGSGSVTNDFKEKLAKCQSNSEAEELLLSLPEGSQICYGSGDKTFRATRDKGSGILEFGVETISTQSNLSIKVTAMSAFMLASALYEKPISAVSTPGKQNPQNTGSVKSNVNANKTKPLAEKNAKRTEEKLNKGIANKSLKDIQTALNDIPVGGGFIMIGGTTPGAEHSHDEKFVKITQNGIDNSKFVIYKRPANSDQEWEKSGNPIVSSSVAYSLALAIDNPRVFGIMSGVYWSLTGEGSMSPKKSSVAKPAQVQPSQKPDHKYSRDFVPSKNIDGLHTTPKREFKARGVGGFNSVKAYQTAKESWDGLKKVAHKVWKNANSKAKSAVYNYTGNGYKWINKTLRGKADIITPVVERINNLTDLIERSSYSHDIQLYRGTDANSVINMFGAGDSSMFNTGSLELLKNTFVGRTGIERGFASCGSSPETGFTSYPVQLKILAPAGTKMMYVAPVAVYGGNYGDSWAGGGTPDTGENETLIQRNTSFKCVNITNEDGTPTFYLEVVAQGDE